MPSIFFWQMTPCSLLSFNPATASWQLTTDWLLNCCWPSPAYWVLVPSPTGLMTIFYCLTALGGFRIHIISLRGGGGSSVYSLGMDRIENTVCTIVAPISVAAETCLLCCCLAMNASTFSTLPAFSRPVTILLAATPYLVVKKGYWYLSVTMTKVTVKNEDKESQGNYEKHNALHQACPTRRPWYTFLAPYFTLPALTLIRISRK
jgi:hypothetical protein